MTDRLPFQVKTEQLFREKIGDELFTAFPNWEVRKMEIKYPTRCRIIDVDGTGHKVGPFLSRTPEKSKPHIGKDGLAERVGADVRITLDDGTELFGYECWWEPI